MIDYVSSNCYKLGIQDFRHLRNFFIYLFIYLFQYEQSAFILFYHVGMLICYKVERSTQKKETVIHTSCVARVCGEE